MTAPRQSLASGSSETWWVALAFVPFFNWTSLLYVGLRSGNSSWNTWAAVYAAPVVLWVLLPDLTDILLFPFFIAWIASIVHAFRVRGDYNRRMDAKRGVIARAAPVARQPAAQPVATSTVQAVDPIDEVIPSQPAAPVDLNHASEEGIAAIPGIGAVLAKRAIAEREKRGGFSSVEDFGQALGLQPHIVERIRPIVAIGATAVQSESQTSTGRVVDV